MSRVDHGGGARAVPPDRGDWNATRPTDDDAPARAPGSVARALASSPVVWRGGVAAIGSIALLTARAGITGLFDEIVGLTMIAIAIVEQLPRLLGAEASAWWRSGVVMVTGVLIFAWPSETAQSIGLLAAAAIGAYGVGKSVQAFVSSARDRRRDRLARGVLTVALAVVVALFPEATVRVVVLAIGLLWIFEAALVASAIGRSDAVGADPLDVAAPHERLGRRLAQREMSQVDRERVNAALFLDSGDARRRLFRFAVLMALATAIATLGVATGSTAVVIGAMLIAPLMTPILATASAVLQGWTLGALRSGAIVLIASGGAIALAWTLAAFIPDLSAVVANNEVTSRTAPNLLDLAIAIAAGAAGAFAVTRSDVSDTLPGVAVAIALVPPLAVTGVTLYAGSFEQALGAALLFGTNLIAMVAMASIVFVLTGYVAWSRLAGDTQRVRASYATVAAGVVLLLIPLGLTSQRVIRDASLLRTSQRVVDQWMAGVDDLDLGTVDVDDRSVTVTLRGPGKAPPAQSLHDALTEAFGDDLVLEVRVVPEVRSVVGPGRSQ